MCRSKCLSPLARASMLASTISAEQPIQPETPGNLPPSPSLAGVSPLHPCSLLLPPPRVQAPDTGRLKI